MAQTQTRKARVAVIGTGWWSTYTHIPGLLANPNAELVALADVNPQKLEAAARHYGIERMYTSVRRMLARERLDGGVVATYHSTHYTVARACLEAGLHVMVEKPMTLTARHAHALLEVAERHGKEIIVGYPYHYTELSRKARQVLASGELGRIQFVSCLSATSVADFLRGVPNAYASKRETFPVNHPGTVYHDPRLSGGGQGHLQVTHSAGSMFFVTGLRARNVSAFMEGFDLPVDMVDAFTVRFDSGAVGVVGSTGNAARGGLGRFEIDVHCEAGRLTLEQHQGTLSVRRHDGREESYGPLAEPYPRFATANNLVDVVLGGAPNGSPGEVGARVVELLDAGYRSARAGGRPVSVASLLRK